jgi:hypothetical protein
MRNKPRNVELLGFRSVIHAYSAQREGHLFSDSEGLPTYLLTAPAIEPYLSLSKPYNFCFILGCSQYLNFLPSLINAWICIWIAGEYIRKLFAKDQYNIGMP